MANKTIQLHFKGNKGIEPSISKLGEITETRKENGMLYYSQLKQQQGFSTNWICLRRFFAWLFISLIFPNSSVIITSFLSLNL
jgi:hypothetical protein